MSETDKILEYHDNFHRRIKGLVVDICKLVMIYPEDIEWKFTQNPLPECSVNIEGIYGGRTIVQVLDQRAKYDEKGSVIGWTGKIGFYMPGSDDYNTLGNFLEEVQKQIENG
jgi:hypothetical protein